MGKKKIDPFLEAEDFEEHGSEIETQDPESGDGPLSVPGEMLQADTEAPGPMPILVVFGQRHPGDEVHIIGSFEGLIQLRDKLSEIIARRQANPEVLGGAVELTDNQREEFSRKDSTWLGSCKCG